MIQKFSKLFLMFCLFSLQIVISQSVVTGVITEASNGAPLPGANVIVKGTKNGVVSDFEGKYSINVSKENTVLQFTYIGYKTIEVSVDGKSVINVALQEDLTSLEEVVIVGYGSQKKENLTGAVTQISSDVIKDRPISRLTDGLQGAIGNLNITSNTGGGSPNSIKNINIRGFTGIGRTDPPLFVIDGIQGGDINSLNPNDIESITVVKDAAASAVYGSSAPNGVIIIRTKKGGKGKTTITYNSNFSFLTPIGVPKMLNSMQFATIYNQASLNAGKSPFFDAETMSRIEQYMNGTLKDETIANPNPGADEWYSWTKSNGNNNWFDIYLKDMSFSQQHSIGVSGGTSETPYYIGIGYNERNGMYKFGDDQYKRLNLKGNISTEVTNWLEVGLRTAYSRETYEAPESGGWRTGYNWFHNIARKHPNVALINPDGEYSDSSEVLFHRDGGKVQEYWDKPTLTGELIFKLAEGWDATMNYTYDATFSDQSSHVKTIYHKLPSGNLQTSGYTAPNRLTRFYRNSSNRVFNAFSTYTFNLKEDHNFKLLAGFVQESKNYKSLRGYNSNLYSDDIPSLSLAYGTSPSVSDAARRYTSQGVFGRLNYDYKGKYLLELVARHDGTSKFLKDVRWKTYPGVSAGWNVHKEDFWNENSTTFNTLKLRASYGSLGDQSIAGGYYPFYPNLGTSSPANTRWLFNNGREAAVYSPRLVDKRLTWVTNTTLDFGFDATFFDSRLTTTFDWYRKKAKDYIGPSETLPAVLGTNPPSANSVAYTTKGFELGIKWSDQIGDDFSYGLNFQLSDYQGTIDKYPNDKKFINRPYVGAKMGDIWGYVTEGYYTDEIVANNSHASQTKIGSDWGPGDIMYKDLDGDGEIFIGDNTADNSGDRKVIGNNTPRYSYSLLTDLKWKNFDLSLFLHGVGKRDVWIGSNYFWGMVGSEWQSSLFEEHLDRWSPENPNGYFPKSYFSGKDGQNRYTQTKYLQDASYLRIKNLQIGFTFPKEVYEKIGMSNFRIFTSIDNLATFSKLKKHSALDPELSIGNGKIYPLQRTYSFGLNVSF